jgi:hypothetical protein
MSSPEPSACWPTVALMQCQLCQFSECAQGTGVSKEKLTFSFFLPWKIGSYNISSLLVMQNPDI